MHWHAVQRDLLTLGLHAVDMFTERLTAGEVMSMIIGAPPGTSVRYVMDGGYTLTDHYLAILSEQQAGLVTLQSRHQRPGVTVDEGLPARSKTRRDVFVDIAAFEARRKAKMTNG